MSCKVYEGSSLWGSVFAAVLALGIFASYTPQHFAVYARKSTEGINPYFLFLMNLGSSFAFTNVLLLSRSLVQCCHYSIGGFDCLSGFLGPLQLFAGWLGPTVLLALARKYREPGENGREIVLFSNCVAVINLASWLAVLLVPTVAWQRRLATYFGLASLAVGLVQYLPQLWTTFRLKHTGSLSVLMLLIQIPGGYMWCLSLAMRRGSHWSTWVPLFCAASFQLTLLCMALWFTLSKRAHLAKRMAVPPTFPPPPQRSARSSPTPAREATPLLPS